MQITKQILGARSEKRLWRFSVFHLIILFFLILKVPQAVAFDASRQLNQIFESTRGAERGTSRAVPETDALTRRFTAPIAFAPWAAALKVKRENEYFCGATLIDARYALTAAHCVDGVSPTDISLQYGSAILSEAQTAAVDKITINPFFNRKNFQNSIAIIHLASPINNSSMFRFPTLANTKSKNSKSGDLKVFGWGVLSEVGELSDRLVQLDVSIMDRGECNSRRAYAGRITPDMLCAASKISGADACLGFSGSGLVSFLAASTELIGLVSWGEGCGRQMKPTVYVNVAYFSRWVEEVVAQD